MLKFRLFGIPVMIEGWFWLSAVLLGGGYTAHNPKDWMLVGVWTAVMFVSILVHEFGHALVGSHFGTHPAIKLHGFGGLTFLPGGHFSRAQSIGVLPPPSGLVSFAIIQALYINFFWTFINLLPIQPLDGGQILRELLGPRRVRVTALIGGVLAVLLCLWSLRVGRVYMALMLALFAFYNFRQEPVAGGVVKE